MERLRKIESKQRRLVAGLMSGTSLDGIDVALVWLEGQGTATKVELLYFDTVPYSSEMRQQILASCDSKQSTVEQICSLNFLLGEKFAEALETVCQAAGISVQALDLIGSHGQTIYHIPGQSTLQIGEAAILAEKTGVITVADFRVRDVAAGGQGAPLVPYTEYLLYRSSSNTRLLQNIGGIANVTVLPVGGDAVSVWAFDNGPGNMLIDYAVRRLTSGQAAYDCNGKMASQGKVHQRLLQELLNHPYFKQKPPKTTGREMFGQSYAENILQSFWAQVTPEDIVATLTYFTARTIADSYKQFILPCQAVDEVIIGGGGSHNQTLLNMLQQELPNILVQCQEDLGLSSDAKEAVAFAILANETISGLANNLPRVTGASHPVVMGKISL